MLYNEFVEGTGCRDNEHNYKVYRDLEIMYMNSDLTKAQIYEYGKKLVDNSKTQKELEFEAEIKEEIAALKEDIESYKRQLEYEEAMLENEIKEKSDCKRMIRFYKDNIKMAKNRIYTLKHFFLDK